MLFQVLMLDISECFWNLIIIIWVTCFAQVSNQQQHRQQPRNGVQQLLQAQQVSLSKVIADSRVFLQMQARDRNELFS